MENKVAIIAIIVENTESVEKLNGILHDYAKYLLGRIGIPYHKKNINIISVAIDAPNDIISALSGKIGVLDGVSVQVAYSK
jgi:putative iron-only hydrogenase system regulator